MDDLINQLDVLLTTTIVAAAVGLGIVVLMPNTKYAKDTWLFIVFLSILFCSVGVASTTEMMQRLHEMKWML